MFDPINKTISQLRDEVAGYIGKKVITTFRQEVTIESVGECMESVIPKNGDYRETFKKDWEKEGKKMYGFIVIRSHMEAGFKSDKKYTYPERIFVPFEMKGRKIKGDIQAMMHENNQITILK